MTRHVRPSPSLPSRSARVRPDQLDFAWERFTALSRELRPLFKQHYAEIALDQELVPLDPDWDLYFTYDLQGVLHVLTARHDGQLVGYVFNLVGSHLHYVSTRFAHTEMFWLHQDFRKGWQPVRMLLENIAGLQAREAVIATINFKLGFKNARVGKLLYRIGYRPTDIVMRRIL